MSESEVCKTKISCQFQFVWSSSSESIYCRKLIEFCLICSIIMKFQSFPILSDCLKCWLVSRVGHWQQISGGRRVKLQMSKCQKPFWAFFLHEFHENSEFDEKNQLLSNVKRIKVSTNNPARHLDGFIIIVWSPICHAFCSNVLFIEK